MSWTDRVKGGPVLEMKTSDHFISNMKVTEISCKGPLDESSREEFKNFINDLLEARRKLLMLNFSALTTIDEYGTGGLIAIKSKIAQAGGEIIILQPNAHVISLFQHVKIEQVMPVFTDLEKALKHFSRIPLP
jgi:anti-anti-sigma factor